MLLRMTILYEWYPLIQFTIVFMFNAKYLIPMGLLVLFLYLKFVVYQPPAERQEIRFTNSVQSVQDSMRTLQKICQSVEPVEAGSVMNCVVLQSDSVLYFKGKAIGKLDSVSVSNEAFRSIPTEDATKLLSLLKFLNRNFVAGLYHDRSMGPGFWLYSYRKDENYNAITGIRSLYLLDEPKDTLNPAFKYYFTILDRKEKLLLLAQNDVRYKQFKK